MPNVVHEQPFWFFSVFTTTSCWDMHGGEKRVCHGSRAGWTGRSSRKRRRPSRRGRKKLLTQSQKSGRQTVAAKAKPKAKAKAGGAQPHVSKWNCAFGRRLQRRYEQSLLTTARSKKIAWSAKSLVEKPFGKSFLCRFPVETRQVESKSRLTGTRRCKPWRLTAATEAASQCGGWMPCKARRQESLRAAGEWKI